jgi:selenocysteine lyase/cysteine desulfurase
VAHNLTAEAGQNIVVLHEQFPSNVYAWRQFRERGVDVITVHPPEGKHRGQGWNEHLLESITPDTALVALGQVHWTDGTLFDLVTIGKRAREVGAALVIDGTQSVGALPFDVQAIQPDALIVAGYKWLMGPYSIGFAYYGERFDQGRPLEDNWIARRGSEDFSRLVDYQDEYALGAVRFDVGERSNPILLPMMIAALDDVHARGVSRIQTYCAALTQDFIEQATLLGYRVEDRAWRAAHLLGLRLPAGVQLDSLTASLRKRQVIVSVRGDAVRVSPNVYNDATDMAALLDALQAAIADEPGHML